MTDTNPPTPPPEPAPPPVAAPPPPPGAPTTWPAAPATAPWQTPPGAWSQPVPPYQTRRNNGLAITALVLGLVPIVFWPLGLFLGIAAVITGHIARKQIRRASEQGTPEQGAGMALAGLILGYIWIALSVLGTVALILILTLAVPAVTQVSVRHQARDFGFDVRSQAVHDESSPRDPMVVQVVYRSTYFTYQSSSNKSAKLPDGTGLAFVTASALRQNNYRIEFSENSIGTKHACLTLPATVADEPLVVDGRCN